MSKYTTVFFKGPGVGSSQLNRIMKNLRPSEIGVILDHYHFLIDNSLRNDEEKIKALICLMPARCNVPDALIMHQLIKGPGHTIPKDYEHTLSNYANYFIKNKDVKLYTDFMREHKHCPDRYKTDFNMLVCIMQNAIDEYMLNTDELGFEEMWSQVVRFCDSYK